MFHVLLTLAGEEIHVYAILKEVELWHLWQSPAEAGTFNWNPQGAACSATWPDR